MAGRGGLARWALAALTFPLLGVGWTDTAALLALAWSLTVPVGLSWLVRHLPQVVVPGLVVAPVVLDGFAGAALLAVAAAEPRTSTRPAEAAVPTSR